MSLEGVAAANNQISAVAAGVVDGPPLFDRAEQASHLRCQSRGGFTGRGLMKLGGG
jgi:hypothetical protein